MTKSYEAIASLATTLSRPCITLFWHYLHCSVHKRGGVFNLDLRLIPSWFMPVMEKVKDKLCSVKV